MAAIKLEPVRRARSFEEGRRNLDEMGVTIHEGFLPPKTLKALQERLAEQAAMEREEGVAWFDGEAVKSKSVKGFIKPGSHIGKPKGQAPFQNISFLPNKGRVFIDLAKNPDVLAYARHLLGERFNVIAMAGLEICKGSPQQFLHYDQLVIPFVAPVPALINFMFVLSDYDEDMGATRFVPGTHKFTQEQVTRQLQGGDYGYFKPQDTVPATAKAGDVIIWDGRTWHGQGESKSTKVRSSISLIYALPFLKPIELYPASMLDEVYDSLTPEERALFDHNADGGWGGRISPRSKKDRRANTNAAFPYVPELRRGGRKHAVPFAKLG